MNSYLAYSTDRLRSVRGSLRRTVAALVDPRRRFNCQNQDRPAWEERAEEAVELLRTFQGRNQGTETLRVADLGCGNERLRRILGDRLQQPFDYVGYDLYPQSRQVSRLDVEQETLPGPFDVVFCLGLLEYLANPELFARRLRKVCRIAIVSYALADAAEGPSLSGRRALGWRTDYTKAGVAQIFETSGFVREQFEEVLSGATGLWLWTVRDDELRRPHDRRLACSISRDVRASNLTYLSYRSRRPNRATSLVLSTI
jgi:SAM-dependent methyltransferase